MPAGRQDEKPLSGGRPDRGASLEIRDAAGHRLPSNSVCEIWARTPRSVECDLPPSPQRRRDIEGYIATGDAGRMDDDGFLYITGRAADLSVKDERLAG